MVYQVVKGQEGALKSSLLGSQATLIALPAILAFAIGLFSPAVLGDGDSYWHVAAGQWMLDHLQVIRTDSFSFTFAGQPWDTHEWLSEVVMALCYRAAGWSGVMALTAAAAAAAMGLTAGRISRFLAPPALILALAVVGAGSAPSFLARPHFLVLPLLVLWLGALLDARAAGRAPKLAWLAVMVLWANAHASFLFGLGLAGAFALEALLAQPKAWRTVIRDWGLFGIGAGLAALVTPHGIDGLLFPFKVDGMSSLQGIGEWRMPDFQHLPPVELALLVGVSALLTRGAKVAPARLAILLVLVCMSLAHVRHGILLVLVGAPLVAEALANAAWRPNLDVKSGRGAVPLIVAGALLLCALRAVQPFQLVDRAPTPVNALAHAPAALRAQPVFNSYDFGGYLIYSGVKPFIDGRTDMYGNAFIARYDSIERGDRAALDKAVAQYHIGWTLLAPASPLVAALDADPHWRRLYADRYAVIHVRR